MSDILFIIEGQRDPLMMNMIKKLLGIKTKSYKIQSFTYFIPAPPARNSGYREKHFDKLFYEFINKGYRILEFKTQSIARDNQSGLWVLFVVQATNTEAEKLNLDDLFLDQVTDKAKVKEEIEGLYYIDDRANEL